MNAHLGAHFVSLNPNMKFPLRRRDFLTVAAKSAIGLAAAGTLRAQAAGAPRVPLGLDAHSLRAMRWKAGQLIELSLIHI